MDFRFLGAVERFCTELEAEEAWLDVVVNNACQTVRRPASYYRHLLEGERAAGTAALAAGAGYADVLSSSTVVATGAGAEGSAAMSQLAVQAEDRMSPGEAAAVLPVGERDVHGQQLDTRSSNSWLLKLGEVET